MDEAAKRLSELASQYSPSVIEAAKAAARTEAYSCLASSAISFGIAFGLIVAWRLCWRLQPNWDDCDDWFVPPRFIGCVLAILAIIPLAIGVWNWIDPWTWVTLNHPELWIAKRVLHI